MAEVIGGIVGGVVGSAQQTQTPSVLSDIQNDLLSTLGGVVGAAVENTVTQTATGTTAPVLSTIASTNLTAYPVLSSPTAGTSEYYHQQFNLAETGFAIATKQLDSAKEQVAYWRSPAGIVKDLFTGKLFSRDSLQNAQSTMVKAQANYDKALLTKNTAYNSWQNSLSSLDKTKVLEGKVASAQVNYDNAMNAYNNSSDWVLVNSGFLGIPMFENHSVAWVDANRGSIISGIDLSTEAIIANKNASKAALDGAKAALTTAVNSLSPFDKATYDLQTTSAQLKTATEQYNQKSFLCITGIGQTKVVSAAEVVQDPTLRQFILLTYQLSQIDERTGSYYMALQNYTQAVQAYQLVSQAQNINTTVPNILNPTPVTQTPAVQQAQAVYDLAVSTLNTSQNYFNNTMHWGESLSSAIEHEHDYNLFNHPGLMMWSQSDWAEARTARDAYNDALTNMQAAQAALNAAMNP